jgi:SAM-dependent methyltransferase
MPDWSDEAPRVDDIPCPLGGHAEAPVRRIVDTVWDAPDGAIYRCEGCDVVFLHPIMSEEDERAFYEAEFDKYMAERGSPGQTDPADHFEKWQPEAERRLANLMPYFRDDMDVLEVGSSTGFLLDAIAPHVRSVRGVEPHAVYREYANERGIETVADLSDIGSEDRFDLLLSYYVVEHMRAPVETLAAWGGHLNPGGICAAEVPNVDDALVRYYAVDAFDRFYWQRAHYFNYSHETLAMVLERAGFDEIEMVPDQRYDISNHVHWMLAGKPGGIGRYTDLLDERVDAEYRRALKENWYCDTVFAVARWAGGT